MAKLSPAQSRALDLLRRGGINGHGAIYAYDGSGVSIATARALVKAGYAEWHCDLNRVYTGTPGYFRYQADWWITPVANDE